MTILQFILSMAATILMGAVAFSIFILAEHKEEIWDTIEFKDEDN